MFSLNEWCQTTDKQDIALHSSKPLSELKEFILFIGGVHGDEPEGVALAEHLYQYLDSSLQTKKDWVLITCLNPYGYANKQRTNSNKVDLNRNFPSHDWSPEVAKARYHPGKSAASEPEVKALSDFIIKMQPTLVLHFHSWKPCIILTGPENHAVGELFSQTSGYPLKNDIGYPTPGSLGQFCWMNLKIPVICIEEAEKVDATSSWKRFKPAFESLLNNFEF